jgi:hypothetical protein
MLQFAVYERKESTIVSYGKVIDLVGKDGKIDLLKKNLLDASKRVVVILKRADGTSRLVPCSEPVSKGLRDKSLEIGHLLNFEIIDVKTKNGEIAQMISMPAQGMISLNVKDITAKEFKVEAVALEDLI